MRTGSLCSGYGGLDLAVHEVLGGELAWVADTDPGAAAILAHRFPGVPNLGDISAARWDEVEPVDMLTAGFPCQDVSCAGARQGLRKDNRTGVWSHVAEAISVLRPAIILLENVRGLLNAGADSDMEPCPWCLGDSGDESVLRACGAVLADLADLGFDAEWALVSAAEAGAPHRRERVFILAWPAADVGGGELQRRGVDRVLGNAAAAELGQGLQRQRPGDTPRHCGAATLADANGTTGGERRIAAPGQAKSRWSRADAGGRGGALAAGVPSVARGVAPNAPRDGRDAWRTEHAGIVGGPDAALDRHGAPADTHGDGLARSPERHGEPQAGRPGHEQQRVDPLRRVLDWGVYELAIRRWERVLGREAPRPTVPVRTGERLNPRFVEWMQGLPEGWVTDVPGLTRNDQLKALGNGVVPQQAAAALRLLLDRAGIAPLVAADTALTETRGAA